jgi:hypothetical protein
MAEFHAILRTLANSVNSGLNATLTPKDCRFLLEFIIPRLKNKTQYLIDKATINLTNLAEELIDELTGKK